LDAELISGAALADDPGVVGDDLAVGVEDRLYALDGDVAGDGFHDAENGDAALGFCLTDLRAAWFVGSDLVDEAGAAVGLASWFDEDFAGIQCDCFDGAVFEIDIVGRDEEEEQDQGDHDVVMKAAALVGPPEIAA